MSACIACVTCLQHELKRHSSQCERPVGRVTWRPIQADCASNVMQASFYFHSEFSEEQRCKQCNQNSGAVLSPCGADAKEEQWLLVAAIE